VICLRSEYQLDVNSSSTIASLKALLQPKAGIASDRQQLFFSGEQAAGQLANELTLAECGIVGNATLTLRINNEYVLADPSVD
jgi:hypothetical protein